MQICIRQNFFHLLPEKAVFWKNKNILLLADVHLSKETHFRKNGIAVPDGITQHNLLRLSKLINNYHPQKIIVLGDLFHSGANTGMQLFSDWIGQYRNIPFLLVSGNHDILPAEEYKKLHIDLVGEAFADADILLVHQPLAETCNEYILCGHIHPAVRITGKAKQSVRIPCFWFGRHAGVLPAFGGFTGMHVIQAKKTDTVFGIAENNVVRIQ
ncbi:MAG: ligase-associated DNA damage response endonuclease PdeM [Chitinophagales bacterium]